jgi:glycosyltransferase involved in cell wall biosynthesis
MPTPITVLIPCKNERSSILTCLDSIKDIAEEILVADSGSTDGTLELVRSRGDCRVIEREYVCSADFKNWAIPQASHDWILLVDADESLTPELAEEIRGLKEGPLDSSPYDAYRIRRHNYFMGKRIRFVSDWKNDWVTRLFRRHCRYEPKWVHAAIDLPEQLTGRLRHPLLHNTYRSFDHFAAKQARYTQWEAKDMRRRGKRATFLHMTLKPALTFLRQYVLRGGFLDGKAGLAICTLGAQYMAAKYAKLWTMQYGEETRTP